MSDVKVTREHREAAMDAVHSGRPSWLGRRWIETGCDYYSRGALNAARAIAAEGHRVRAAVVADLRALAEQADIVDQGSSVLYVRVDSIESLIIELEAQS